jgi:hypothetical protein
MSNEQYIRNDNSKPIATFIGNETGYLNSDEYVLGSRYLAGINSNNLNAIYIDTNCYGISEEVENPEDYLCLLFDTISSDLNLVLAFNYGIPEVDYVSFNDYWINWQKDKLPGFIVPSDFTFVEYGVNPPYNIDLEAHQNKTILYEQQKSDYISNIDYSKLYCLPYICSDSFINNSSAFMGNQDIDFNEYVLQPIFLNSVSINDALDNYKKQFRLSGTKNAIYRINEMIGEITSYDYDE